MGKKHRRQISKFGNDGKWAYSSSLIDAVNRCASAGSHIINMSLSGPDFNYFERAKFDELYAQGILMIAAAGNYGNTDFRYPASYPSVMSVAAIDSNKVVASFSNRTAKLILPRLAWTFLAQMRDRVVMLQ